MSNIKGLLQKAIEYHKNNDFGLAEQYYQKIIKIQPGHLDANFLLGILYLKQMDYDSACLIFRKVILIKPDFALAYSNLGVALKELGKFKDAEECCRKAIALKQDNVEAHINLGTALQEQGKFDEAIEIYNSAISLNPKYAMAYSNLGTVFEAQTKLDKAIEAYRKAITLKPDYDMAYVNLSDVLQKQDKLNEANEACVKAITLNPNNATAHVNLGAVLLKQGKLNEANEACRKAITLNPNNATAHANLGAVFQKQGKHDEAMMAYNKAIILNPDNVDAHIYKSILFLLNGSFSDGWLEYEWRLNKKPHSMKNLNKPKWDGSFLNGQRILVYAEQGFGDTFQFIRFLPLVRERGGYVIFECPQVLSRLLINCDGVDELIEGTLLEETTAQYDVYIPLLSLAKIFEITLDNLPAETPYIQEDTSLVSQWRKRLDNNSSFKIGLVWGGNPEHCNDRNRSCSLAEFAPLATIPGVTFYSLQKGPQSLEVFKHRNGMKIINLENELVDFADTAAAICNLDLVISIDSAVAHLAGAIGKPIWTLLPFAPDWRWLKDRDNSPWYPTMRLFRQDKPNDWKGVFGRVRNELITMIK